MKASAAGPSLRHRPGRKVTPDATPPLVTRARGDATAPGLMRLRQRWLRARRPRCGNGSRAVRLCWNGWQPFAALIRAIEGKLGVRFWANSCDCGGLRVVFCEPNMTAVRAGGRTPGIEIRPNASAGACDETDGTCTS